VVAALFGWTLVVEGLQSIISLVSVWRIPTSLAANLYHHEMASSNIQYLALSSVDELQRHKAQWDALDARSSQHPAMHSFAWIANHFKSFVLPGQSWACLVAVSNEQVIGSLPLVFRKRLWPAPHTVAQSAYGSHLNITDILCSNPEVEEISSGLIDFAFKQYPGLAYINLPRVPGNSPTASVDFAGLSRPAISRNEISSGYFLPLPDSFSDYQRSFSKNFRNNLKKATNKLVKLENVEYEFLGSDADLSTCFKRFCDLERSGWKGRSGTAIAESDSLVDFYLAVLQELQHNGVLEWHFLSCADGDLAAHMAFRSQGKLVVWKIAYNESFSPCSPGSQLLRELIKREIEARECDEIDLTTEHSWVKSWNWSKRSYFQVFIRRPKSVISALYRYIDGGRVLVRNNNTLRRGRAALQNILKDLSSIRSRLIPSRQTLKS
jgi:CelD/BcsL family acetyltransferase involved in cellulose biosynthesis